MVDIFHLFHKVTPKDAGTTKGGEEQKPQQEEATEEARHRLKRERALRKKLKQIRDLEERIASGEISKPDRDQLAKIAKKADIEDELLDLTDSS